MSPKEELKSSTMKKNEMNGKRKSDQLLTPEDEHSAKRQETSHEAVIQQNEINIDEEPSRINATENASSIRAKGPLPPTPPVEAHHSVLPLSMQLMKPFWSMNCINCSTAPIATGTRFSSLYDTGPRPHTESTPSFIGKYGEVVGSGSDDQQLYCSPIWYEKEKETDKTDDDVFDNIRTTNEQTALLDDDAAMEAKSETISELRNRTTGKIVSSKDHKTHLESIPPSPRDHTLQILHEYMTSTQLYGCRHVNAGVITALRFSLPTLRVAGSFHDADMLALAEILFRHCNGALSHIKRLDFSIAGRYGKLHGRKGFGSHGAFTLSRVLCISKHIDEVFVQRNKIGPYGAAAIFAAASKNPTIRNIEMRRCGIGEKGALAFVDHIGKSELCALRYVDMSVNGIGFRGSIMIEEVLIELERKGTVIDVDLEGNLVLQEVMNGVTHGLGVIMCLIGAILMHHRVRDSDANTRISCGVYSASLLVLYISSTLYHSFFALKYTRYIFECLDHCAIYILITGSYTPFLRIALHDKPLGSFYLLIFLYFCCAGGVIVEAFYNSWIHKSKFSLAMYLGMGWSCMICMPQMMEVLPKEAINLVMLGGIGYTSGVPFFIRNNNLDHSIWHCFVLAGSIFHWVCVYVYVTRM